jgi:hypothetical protein
LAIEVLKALLEEPASTSEESEPADTSKGLAEVPSNSEVSDAHHLLVKSLAEIEMSLRAAA